MSFIVNILPYTQIILAILLVGSILLQQGGNEFGGAIGGGDSGGFHHTKRGFEKFLLYFTIAIASLFALTALLSIILK